jgi:Predicted Peptidoglycan domain
MSVADARDYYKKQYLDDISGFTSVRVKAAYLNLAVNMGKVRAVKIFQAAANKLGTSVAIDGTLGPSTQQFINATDPDQFIETANCEAAKVYISLGHPQFLKGWIARLQMFSPVDLKGICPEVQSLSSSPGSSRFAPKLLIGDVPQPSIRDLECLADVDRIPRAVEPRPSEGRCSRGMRVPSIQLKRRPGRRAVEMRYRSQDDLRELGASGWPVGREPRRGAATTATRASPWFGRKNTPLFSCCVPVFSHIGTLPVGGAPVRPIVCLDAAD